MSTYYVRKDGSGTHTTIQSAIYDSSAGDIVDVGPGTWYENIELYKSITLQGAGKTQTFIEGKISNDVFSGASFYSGEDTVTLASTSGLIKGRLVSGTNIAAGSRISEIISDTKIKLSLPTVGAVAKTATTLTAASSTIVLPNTTSLAVGQKVTGVGVDATITALNATTKTITLSSPVSISGINIALTFKSLRTNVTITQLATFTGSSIPATIQVMNTATNGFAVKSMTITGFDGTSPAVEASAMGINSPAVGSHENWLIDDCKFIAAGDSALLTSSNLKSINGTVQNCTFSGKTFAGSEPVEVPGFSQFTRSGVVVGVTATTYSVEFSSLIGIIVGSTATSSSHIGAATVSSIVDNVVTFNKLSTETVGNSVSLVFTNIQFIVPNVARQLVIIGNSSSVSACLNTTFKNNLVNGQTGEVISSSGNKSVFNTAVTVDTVGGLIENNTIAGYFGAGDPNTVVANFAIRSRRPDSATSETIIRNNINDQRGGHKNSGFYFPGGVVSASNNTELNDSSLVKSTQLVANDPVKVSMELASVKSISKIATSVEFANDTNWSLFTFIFKKQGSSKRLVASFSDFSTEKSMKLRSGMSSGDSFELHKIIVSKADRTLLVVKRSEIEEASSFDFILK